MSVPAAADTGFARRLELAEARATEEFFAAAPPASAEALGIWKLRLGEACAFGTRSYDSLLFNRVVGMGMESPARDADLDLIADLYPHGGMPFAVNLSPFARPPDLSERLARRGFATYFSWAMWHRDAAPPAPVSGEARVERVGAEAAPRVAALCAEVFEMPPPVAAWLAACVGRPGWSHYLAFLGDETAGIGALLVQGGNAWLGSGGTRAACRGRGVQSALLARRIADAAAAGCDLLTVQTAGPRDGVPNASYRNVQRMGFRLAYLRPSWVFPDPAR